MESSVPTFNSYTIFGRERHTKERLILGQLVDCQRPTPYQIIGLFGLLQGLFEAVLDEAIESRVHIFDPPYESL